MTETRSVRVRVSATLSDLNREFAKGSAAARRFADDLERTDQRMSGIVQTGLALGPALVPIGATAVPAVAALASGFTAAAAGAGVAALAFQGVGDALTAVNDYKLEPTAENLEKMQAALQELGPAGADFVRYLQSLRPELDGLQSIARQGMFPGVEEGIRDVMGQLPIFEDIVGNVSTALGEMAREGGEALAGPFWTDFFEFIREDTASALEGMGRGFGNIAEGLAGLTMAMDPVADDFGRQLLEMSEAFSTWGREVGQTQDFREFIDYLQGVGPQAGDTLLAVGNALVQLAQAAAPVGGVVLEGIEAIAHTLAAIANIPLVGPALIGAAAGIAALSRAVALWKASGMASLVTGLRGVDAEGKKASAAMTAVGRGGLVLAGLAVGVSVLDNLGRSLSDTLPGLNELQNRMRDLASGDAASLGPQFDDLGESIQKLAAPNWVNKASNFLEDIGLPPTREMREAQEDIAAIDTALTDLVASKGPGAARQMFAAITEGMDPRTVKQFLSLLPGYRDAMAGVGADADVAAEGLSRAEQAAQRLSNELANLSANLERRSALRAYRDSIRQFNQTLRDGPKNLQRGTAAWDAAMGALDGIAASSVTAASHLRGLNKIRFMQQARKDFIDRAQQMGLTAGAAERLANRLGLVNQRGKINIHLRAQGLDKATQDLNRVKEAAARVPKRIDARVEGDTGDAERDLSVVANKLQDLDRDTASPKAQLRDDASGKINAVQGLMRNLAGTDANPSANLNDNASGGISRVGGLLSGLDGRTATVTIQTREITTQVTNVLRNIVPRVGSAEGNIFEAYGSGDVRDRHMPQLGRGDVSRIWNEPETKGESYIPHADDHRRPRAIDIWERTGDILGVNFVRLADGGMSERERALASGLREFRSVGDRSDMASELRDLQRTLREAFGRNSAVLKAFGKLDERLLRNAKQAERLAKASEELHDRMRDLRSQRSSLEQSVSSNFLSDEAFGGSMDDLDLWLRANRNDARRMQRAQRTLGRRGASDAFLRELAESGNFTLAQELAGASKRELRNVFAAFASRSQEARQLGNIVGHQVLGDEMRRNNRELRQNRRETRQNTQQMRRNTRALERRISARAGGAHRRARGGR